MANDGKGKTPGEGFALTTLPRRSEISCQQLEAWAKVYESSVRQVRRWLAEGEKAGDPCPLDNPSAFPDWWVRHKKWGVPEKISRAASAAGGGEAGRSAVVGAPVGEVIDIKSLELAEGEAVQQARRFLKAAADAVDRAYATGAPVDHLLQRHSKANESLRKLEKDEREAAKARGDWIPRPVVEKDAATAMSMFKFMRESMVRKVREKLPGVDPDLLDLIGRVILEVREKEDFVFRNLRSVKSLEDVEALLAA